MARFKKTLEEKAHSVIGVPRKQVWDNSIPAMIRREIALTVDHIKSLREQHDEQFQRLLRVECEVDTELLQLEDRRPKYLPHHFPERLKLKQQLFEIEKDRRNLSLKLEEKTQSLEDRLLSLINKHEQLDI